MKDKWRKFKLTETRATWVPEMLIVDQGLECIVDADGTFIRKQPEQMTALRCSVDYLIRKANEPP